MALVNLSDKVKAIILLAIQLIAAAVLGFAEIFGWTLELWIPITTMIVIMLDTVLGIVWIVPERAK